MNRVFSLLTFCAALAACNTLNPAPLYSQDDTVSFDDVILLVQSDISDQTIMTFLDFRRLGFALDAEALLRLREAGVNEAVIRYLLEQDSALSTPSTYTVPYVYSTRDYPSYYYGSRRIGGTAFPFGWYNHRYFGLGNTTIYHDAPHYNGGHNLGHAVAITPVHHDNIAHTSSVLGGHRSSLGHNTRHTSSRVSHGARHRRGHSGGHRGHHGLGH